MPHFLSVDLLCSGQYFFDSWLINHRCSKLGLCVFGANLSLASMSYGELTLNFPNPCWLSFLTSSCYKFTKHSQVFGTLKSNKTKQKNENGFHVHTPLKKPNSKNNLHKPVISKFPFFELRLHIAPLSKSWSSLLTIEIICPIKSLYISLRKWNTKNISL